MLVMQQGRFSSFEYKGGKLCIPLQAWDLKLEGPPVLGREIVDDQYERGQEIIRVVVDYLVDFAKEFKKVDITEAVKSKG